MVATAALARVRRPRKACECAARMMSTPSGMCIARSSAESVHGTSRWYAQERSRSQDIASPSSDFPLRSRGAAAPTILCPSSSRASATWTANAP